MFGKNTTVFHSSARLYTIVQMSHLRDVLSTSLIISEPIAITVPGSNGCMHRVKQGVLHTTYLHLLFMNKLGSECVGS